MASPTSAEVLAGNTCTVLGTCGTGVTVSGSVHFAGALPTAASALVVTLRNVKSPTALPYAAIIPGPANPTSFTFPGVAPGTYLIRATLDYNSGTGVLILGRGDLLADEWRVGNVVVPEINLELHNAFVNLGVTHTLNGGADYSLKIAVRDGSKLPVAIAIANGTGNQLPQSPLTLRRSDRGVFTYSSPPSATRPAAGETYPATVTYDDGSQEAQTLKISTVLDEFPSLSFIAPASADTASVVVAWRTPPPVPGYLYVYTTLISPGAGPGTKRLNADSLFTVIPPPPGRIDLPLGAEPERRFRQHRDQERQLHHLRGRSDHHGVHAATGTRRLNISITGSGFSADATVSFNGSEGVISSVDNANITVTATANASTGPVMVTVGATTTASATPFTPTIGVVGTVRNNAGSAWPASPSTWSATLPFPQRPTRTAPIPSRICREFPQVSPLCLH